MQDDKTNATAAAGPGLSEGLGQEPERAEFEAWQSDSGRWTTHAAWVVWQGAWKASQAAERERLLATLGLIRAAALDAVRDDWTAGYARGIGACEEVVRGPNVLVSRQGGADDA